MLLARVKHRRSVKQPIKETQKDYYYICLKDDIHEGDYVLVEYQVKNHCKSRQGYFGIARVEELLEGARSKVRELGKEGHAGGAAPVRYAIAYEGAVADEAGAFQDAVIVEFGERGRTSYSAFSYVEGKGSGDGFRWSDPAPAGVTESLL